MPDSSQSSPADPGLDTARLDSNVAHTARVWDFWLGGKDNFAADRVVGTQILEFLPNMVETARADRAFLGRAVRFLAGEAGIRQFLDIGTGLPTADNTHQVAQAVEPRARIVYVDNDPLVLVHARALLTSTPEGATDYIEADLHDPALILREAARTLDFTQPTAVMLLGILNFIADYDQARQIVHTLMDAMPSGSYLAVAHASNQANPQRAATAQEFWNHNATPPIRFRNAEEIAGFFDGLDLLPPGVVSCSRWRPMMGNPAEITEVDQFSAVGRKP